MVEIDELVEKAGKAKKRSRNQHSPPPVVEHRIVGDRAYVGLTRGVEAIVDLEDLPLVLASQWAALLNKGRYYAVRYAPPGQPKSMHRLVMNAQPGFNVDHINGDSLDNRRSNLRLASTAENMRNTGKHRNNTSGLKGVSFDKSSGKWQASITFEFRQINLGRFKTKEEAAAAYIGAARCLHGEFARTKDLKSPLSRIRSLTEKPHGA